MLLYNHVTELLIVIDFTTDKVYIYFSGIS